jgi:hypothetical protein
VVLAIATPIGGWSFAAASPLLNCRSWNENGAPWGPSATVPAVAAGTLAGEKFPDPVHAMLLREECARALQAAGRAEHAADRGLAIRNVHARRFVVAEDDRNRVAAESDPRGNVIRLAESTREEVYARDVGCW